MNKAEIAATFATAVKATMVAVRGHTSQTWHGERPEVVDVFRRINASKEFTVDAAHKAFAGAKRVK
jgi:hypothetical protein